MSNAQPEESTTVAPSDTTAPTPSRPRRPAIARPEGTSAQTFLTAKAALSQAVEPISTPAYHIAAPGTPKQRYKQADAALTRVEKALARASKIAADAQDAADEAGDVLDGLKKLEAGAKDIMLAEAKAAKLAKAAERAMDDVLTAQKALQAALNDRQTALDAVKAEDGDDLPADASPAMPDVRRVLRPARSLVLTVRPWAC